MAGIVPDDHKKRLYPQKHVVQAETASAEEERLMVFKNILVPYDL